MPWIKNRLIFSKGPLVFSYNTAITDDYYSIGIYPYLYDSACLTAINTVSVTIIGHKRTGCNPGRTFPIPIERGGRLIM